MQKKKLFTVSLVLLFIMQLVTPTFSPKVALSQDVSVNEKQVACGDIVENEFINNVEDHIYLLPMQPRESFEVAIEPAGDDMKTVVAIYGPSGIRIKISGDYYESHGYSIAGMNQISQAPKLVSGKLSATGLYKIRVANTAIVIEGHQDILNDKLFTDNRFLGGVGAYTLSIGCTKADQITRIEPGDTVQSTPASTSTEQTGVQQTSLAQESTAETQLSFLEVGQTYEIAFGSQTKIMKVVELRSDGWTKVEVESRVGWLNINQVALITPLTD